MTAEQRETIQAIEMQRSPARAVMIYYDDVRERWVARHDDRETVLRERDAWCDGNAIDEAEKATGVPAEDIVVELQWC